MKLLSILLTAILCATASAQTIKSLGYNTTNGQVVYSGTNTLTFTNTVQITTLTNVGGGIFTGDMNYANNGISGYGGREINFEEANIFGDWTIHGSLSWNNTTNAATTRTNLGLGATDNVSIGSDGGSLTTDDFNAATINVSGAIAFTNAAATRTNLGLGQNDSVWFGSIAASELRFETNAVFEIETATFLQPLQFHNPTNAAITRTNLGLPLAALTNTSNVTMMRALSGSTNTNEPYSGSISVVGTNNTNTLVYSNGILQSVQ